MTPDAAITALLSHELAPSAAPPPVSLPDQVLRHVREHVNNLNVATAAIGVETRITGTKLPHWIKPLHFEDNLNAALDALESVEALLAEHRQLLMAEMQRRDFARSLSGERLAEHERLVAQMALEDYRANLCLRLAKRLTDLIEHGKAAKLGAMLLFRMPVELFEVHLGAEFGPGEIGINILREGLRRLLNGYRILLRGEKETILPVSLKHARAADGSFLTDAWVTKQNTRDLASGLRGGALTIDLNSMPDWIGLRHPRLRRVGVQVIDRTSGIVPAANTESPHLPTFWFVRLEFDPRGVPLGYASGTDREGQAVDWLKPGAVEFPDVPGARSQFAVSWSSYDQFTNLNPLAPWNVSIDQVFHPGRGLADVRDIVLHFHVAYQTESYS